MSTTLAMESNLQSVETETVGHLQNLRNWPSSFPCAWVIQFGCGM